MKKIFYVTVITASLMACSSNNLKKNNSTTNNIQAVDDYFSLIKNKSLTLKTLLENDKTSKNTIISKYGTSSFEAIIVKNSNNEIIYTPKKDFIGKDSFSYTICEGENCSTAKVFINVTENVSNITDNNENNNQTDPFKIPNEIKSYYSSLTGSENSSELKSKLKQIISNYTNLNYGDRHDYLYRADADLTNPNDVVLVYSGEKRYWKQYLGSSYPTQTFNTEHIYPKSKLNSAKAKSDLHHLRSCDQNINSVRGNKPFSDGSGTYSDNGSSWFPGDQWKGDVARMIFYLNVMYDSSFDPVGSKELFLKWNKEDPVSAFEKQRNDEIQKAQNNRNPFIDNPFLASLIYGGKAAENLWN